MTAGRVDVRGVLDSLGGVRVGVIGDFALDIYFDLIEETGEISLETGRPVRYGSGLRSQLGAAGNLVSNLHALGVGEICVFGATGDDLLGHELMRNFSIMEVNTDHFLVEAPLPGCAYVKPFEDGSEASRIDFGTSWRPDEELKDRVLEALTRRSADLDVVILNRQFVHPLLDGVAIQRLNSVIRERPALPFCADFRRDGHLLRGAVLKVNASEVAGILGCDPVDRRDTANCMRRAREVAIATTGPVLLTRGECGLVYVDADVAHAVPGSQLVGELDTVGAGDSVIAAFAACVGAGADMGGALTVANAAAAVTVRKLRQTGTASPAEIEAMLAADMNQP